MPTTRQRPLSNGGNGWRKIRVIRRCTGGSRKPGVRQTVSECYARWMAPSAWTCWKLSVRPLVDGRQDIRDVLADFRRRDLETSPAHDLRQRRLEQIRRHLAILVHR